MADHIRRRVCRHCPFRETSDTRSVLSEPGMGTVDPARWVCHSDIIADPWGTGGDLCRGVAIATGAIPAAGEPVCSIPTHRASAPDAARESGRNSE